MADIPKNLGTITGPPFLGIILNNYLYGILTLQYYNYHVNFRSDYTFLRVIVHTQFVLETAQTIMSIADGFHWYVYGFGNFQTLQEYFLSNIDTPVMVSIIAFTSQAAYCWRIYHLSGWVVVTLVIALGAFGQATGALVVAALNQKAGSISGWSKKTDIFLTLWTVCSVITDALIAGAMTYLLLSPRLLGRHRKSRIAIRIVRLVVETNLASASIAIVVLLTATVRSVAPPKSSLFFCPSYVLGKLYSNSFLAMLNNRQFSGGLVEPPGVDIDNIAMERQGINQREPRPPITPSPAIEGIAIHTETAVHFDSALNSSMEHRLKPLGLGGVV